MSFFNIIASASFVVQMVVVILIFMSIRTWVVIYQKYIVIKKAKSNFFMFLNNFVASKGNIIDFYNNLKKQKSSMVLEKATIASMKNFMWYLNQDGEKANSRILEGAKSIMEIAISREDNNLKKHLGFLATTGSIAPYIGLFGTVWGIMHSFMELSGADQVTIAAVAPGISEALVATVIGLFAAIPAVMAYNKFLQEIDSIVLRYYMYVDELLLFMQKYVIESKKSNN